jgi:Ca-activated chloride channel family protein
MNQPAAMTANLGFASAVAEFGMVLRESPLRGNASFESAKARAKTFLGEDEEGYRAQFVQLVDRAAMLRERAADKVSRR